MEGHCRKFYAPRMRRPGLAPGIYFRSLLIGYFEGLDSEPRDRVASGAFAGAASFCAPRDYGADAEKHPRDRRSAQLPACHRRTNRRARGRRCAGAERQSGELARRCGAWPLTPCSLNAMRKEGSKDSLRGKFKRAEWDNAFRFRLLEMFCNALALGDRRCSAFFRCVNLLR